MSVNKVILVGNLGSDVEVRFTPGGEAVANFNVATSEKWKTKDGKQEERTEWHRIVVWGKLAELCEEYLAKGRKAYIEGKLQTRKYEKDGVDRYVTEIKAHEVQFLDAKGSESKPESGAQKPAAKPQGQKPGNDPVVASYATDGGEDIPF